MLYCIYRLVYSPLLLSKKTTHERNLGCSWAYSNPGPKQVSPNPGTYSIPCKKIISDTRISSLISRFAVYPWFTHIAVNGTPVFEQMRFLKTQMGDFRGIS